MLAYAKTPKVMQNKDTYEHLWTMLRFSYGLWTSIKHFSTCRNILNFTYVTINHVSNRTYWRLKVTSPVCCFYYYHSISLYLYSYHHLCEIVYQTLIHPIMMHFVIVLMMLMGVSLSVNIYVNDHVICSCRSLVK